MLTARGEVTDRHRRLELGADDYLPKPFETQGTGGPHPDHPRRSRARLNQDWKRAVT